MAAAQNLYLAFALMEIINELLGILNLNFL